MARTKISGLPIRTSQTRGFCSFFGTPLCPRNRSTDRRIRFVVMNYLTWRKGPENG